MQLTKWLNKTVITSILSFAAITHAEAQHLPQLSLEEAQRFARENYPLLKRKELIRQTEETHLRNLNKGYLPQLSLNSQATYQSEVTQINISLPGININPLSKDQYKATADVNQLLFDGGLINQQKKIQKLSADTEEQRTEVELYKFRERVDQLFLNVLYLGQQQRQIYLIQKDLDIGIAKLDAQVKNGVAFRSSLDVLKAERLITEQRNLELQSAREGLIDALSVLTGKELATGTEFQLPKAPALSNTIHRPELSLFENQRNLLQQQKKTIAARNLPKASLFGQGGYGRPGLNFLKDDFDWFYIAGARLSWNLGNMYSQRGERKLVDLNKREIEIQKQTFLINTESQLKQQSAEIKKLEQLLAADEEIIAIREKVKKAASAQLENGVTTANDYLREVNAEDQARQARIAHQLQLLQAQINYQNLTGI